MKSSENRKTKKYRSEIKSRSKSRFFLKDKNRFERRCIKRQLKLREICTAYLRLVAVYSGQEVPRSTTRYLFIYYKKNRTRSTNKKKKKYDGRDCEMFRTMTVELNDL